MYDRSTPQGEKKEIKCEVIKILKTHGEHGKRWTDFRVVRWNDRWVNLEKREFYVDRDTGEERVGKAKGFDLADILYMQENMTKILNIVKSASMAGAR